ncbi:MAG: AMP-binding protein, partial [Acidobacteriota bacterium]
MDARGELATLDLATGCDEPASLVDVARQWARARQDRIAYRFLPDGDPENAAEISYGDLDREARKIAAYLQDRLDPGERAMLVYRTGLEFVAAFLGCLYAGVIAVPTSPPRNVRQLPRLQVIEEDARPAVVLTSSDHLDGGSSYLAEGLDRLGVEMVATDTLGAGLADGWRRPEIDPHSLAFLQYTSGSTARPKGVMVSHGNLVYNEEMLARAWGHTDGARTAIACWTPLFHDMGLIGNVLQSLYVGAECALMTPTTFLKRPQAWLQAISHYRATTAGAPNFAYEYCARKVGEEDKRALDLSSWRVAFNAAEPVHRASLEAFAEAFAPCGLSREALYPCYGLAEATVFATGGALDAPPVYKEVDRAGIEEGRVVEADDQRDGAERSALTLVGCGGPWLDEELRVVDPETCEELPRGRVGEIWIAGAHVARGYWRNEEATRRTFRATLASGGDTTYMRTGDMGFVEDGQLYLTGRLKDMIICRGRNVHPEDVERQVQVEVPQVRPGRVAAFGVDRGGDEHLVVAAELRQPKASIAGEVTASILDCVTQAHEVSVHDIALLPKGVIPKTTSGKIQRARCRTLYLEDDLDPIVTWRSGVASAEIGEDSPPAETVIRKALERLVGPKARRLEPDRSLTSVGLDSLRAIELCNLLEADLGVEVPVSELLSGAGIGDLVERANGGRTVRRSPRPDRPERAQAPTADDPGTADAAAEPFPLNDLQQAYWAGRGEDFDLGGVAAHVYLELDGRDVNLGRLERAWNRLIERHDVLRTVVLSEGTQRVLPEAP